MNYDHSNIIVNLRQHSVIDYAFTHNGRAIIASSNKFSDLYFTRKPFRALSFCHLDTSIQCPSQTTLSFAGPDLIVAQPLCLIVSQFMSS